MNMFLEPFVNRMNVFSDEGITCNIRGTLHTIYVYSICSCDDSVARAPMQGIVQFNGYFGCNWCLHPGYYIAVGRGGSVKYISLDEAIEDRNHADTLRDARLAVEFGQAINGVVNESVLTRLTHFNIISGFVPDPMHFMDLGIGKQFAKYWFDTSNMPYSLTNAEIDRIDAVLRNITVPSKLMRNSRSIKDRKYWKAKEFQNWILYFSMVVLLMIPRMRVYATHWSYFVRAYYILLRDNITREQLREAHRLLTLFVALTEFYYGRSSMTYNVHQLLHAVQSTINWGSLYYHSGYGFENGNGEIVKMVNSAKGVQYQICRMIGMNRSDRILTKFILENYPDSPVIDYVKYLETKECTKVLTTNVGRYFGVFSRPTPEWTRLLNLSNAAIIYKKLIKSGCTFLSCNTVRLRTNNSFAITTDNHFIQIVFYIIDRITEQEYTVCKNVDVVEIIDDNEFDQFQIKRVVAISEELTAINTNNIDKICVYMNCHNERYLCPVPNMHSY
ncbi:uncharacterized protein LOC131670273 isoform X1 [Phymastichus coffea]|nr:uncharacterized protein LOC131670273 isoform X1 [Phymastichus coffea]